jgi:phospholipid/cholesterol/gamma-HCH transport system substrate-binding protein
LKKYSHETVVGFFVIFGLLCIGYMTVKLGNVSLLGDDSYALYAEFESVSGLKVNNPVEILGMEVGRVGGFQMDQERGVAVVELRIRKGLEIFDDAIASVKTAGLIGDKFVSIDVGGSGDLLEPGETIIDTQTPIDLEEIIGKYAFGDTEGP